MKNIRFKNEKISESETSEPEDSDKSNWSDRLVRKLLTPNILVLIMRKCQRFNS